MKARLEDLVLLGDAAAQLGGKLLVRAGQQRDQAVPQLVCRRGAGQRPGLWGGRRQCRGRPAGQRLARTAGMRQQGNAL